MLKYYLPDDDELYGIVYLYKEMCMFAFDSKTDEQIQEIQNRALLPEGIYPFTVKAYKPGKSKAQNDMLELLVSVVDKDGSKRNIKDFLVNSDQMIFKIKHFCESIGFEKEYTSGKFDPEKCLNRSGRAVVGIQKGSAKPDGSGFYPDKNNIRDYMKADDQPPFDADEDVKY